VTALSVASQFTATLPDLAFEQAVGTMDATATFVEISGTRIDELVADVAFDAGRVVLDLMVAQGSREFEIAGDLVPHPDHREVHLQRLALRAGGAVWQLQAEEAVIQYAPGRVEVRDLALVSGAGFLRIEGAFGEGSEAPLTVTTENVRLQDLNEMALGTHTFEGSLDMTAVVTGTMAAPIVQADLVVDGGSIDGQPFRSVTGSGGFRDHQVSLDFEMDAGAFGFLTATGTLPLAAGAPEGTTLPPYDVTVRSTALDLTFLQPLTSTIEELAGTGTVDLRVEGDAEAPAINGTVTLSDVGFMVPATGVAYQRLNADLAIQGQQLVVEQLALEDADGNPATVSGVLDLPGVADRNTFELVVSTDELVVLDNDLGEIAVSVNLQALGDLQTPLLAGTITVDRGVVEVSDLLEQLSSSGYEAAPVEETAETTDLSDASPYERSSLSVTLAVPGNLVVRGRDLRGGRGPIGLGDVNVTLQGALLIAKETGEEPTLIGTVDVIRGQYDFQGRQFTIARGSQIAFQGTTSNPALDVSAERVVSGVTATVHLGGTLARPEVELSSSPMLDQGDILSLIVFNQPMNALPTAERVSLGARAAALAASAIATPLADSVARALDLDVFEIQPTAEAGGGASVRIGRQVGDNLFLGVSQEFGREDVTQVSFEYRLNEYISIITSVSHGSGGQTSALRRAQEAGIDLIYTRR
jgi:translocation and assembly module TamB